MAFISELTLCGNVPLDPRYEHTLKFTSKAAQLAWFQGMRKYSPMDDFSYLRKEQAIKVNINVEALEDQGVNYLFTINNSKARFYFVTAKEYVSESCTKLHIELDVLQTYQFDWNIPACFVEREHVTNDAIGANLMDEGLELGEYVTNSMYDAALGSLAIVVQSSVTLANPIGEHVSGSIIGGVYSGLALYTRSCDATGKLVLDAVINSLETQGKADAITSMWVYPKRFIAADWDSEDDETMLPVIGITPYDMNITGNTTLDGYTPRNNKLLCFPYNFLYVHNNTGECAFYHYEKFTGGVNGTLQFRVTGNIGEDGTVRIMPRNYSGMALDNDSGLSLGGYPTCAWTQDAYKIWLAQNANTQALSIQSGQISAGLGAAMVGAGAVQAMTPGGEGGGHMAASGVSHIYSGYQQIAGVMAARKDAQVQPPQAKGRQSSNCNIYNSMHTFTFQRKSIRAEFARAIDNFFDMYGYKVNRVKTPNITGRANWNYVKTIGAVVMGDIDAQDRIKIGAILDKGVTFWHNYLTMYNYTNSNGVT